MNRIVQLAALASSLTLVACASVDGTHLGGDMDHHSHVTPAPEPEKVVEAPPPDRDGDGIIDALDNCPDEVGTEENNGCEAAQMVAIKAGGLDTKERIYFATGSDVIESRSFALLDQVAAVLNRHMEVHHVMIQGHTDNTGDAAFNKDLSERRAKSVMTYLLEHGIDADRLEARGYGDEKPRESNDTEEGRSANRRVEFRFSTTG